MKVGSKKKWIIIGIVIIIIGIIVAIVWWNHKPRPYRVSVTEIKRMAITLYEEEDLPALVIGFETGQWYSIGNTDERYDLNPDKLADYYDYVFEFLYGEKPEKNKIREDSKEQPGEGEMAEERYYWDIAIVNQDGKTIRRSGTDSFPAGWEEFINRTNDLIGEDYLPFDTHGLPIR